LDSQNKTLIQESHSDGEVWGLGLAENNYFITSCDDNKVKAWNMSSRKCIGTGIVCNEARKVKRGGASSLTDMADSQCARAVAYNKTTKHVAVGHNDGTMTIRASKENLDQIIA